jgi:leucyl aminopeptidase
MLGAYRFDYYKTDKKDEDQTVVFEKLFILKDGANQESLANAVSEGKIIAENVNYARDLINHPAQYMTPSKLAAEAAALAAKHSLDITVLEKEEMSRQNMNALLAVAQGSAQPPKLIAIKYAGNPKSQEIIGFVGKGITFDSGGISIKPADGMEKMIRDMAGAAAVLGAIAAIAELKLKINVLSIMPCTENMPSGSAVKPGDIVTSMSGKTIEIVNTDAEGRLILADAVTYAQKQGATYLVDVATLTGACVVALGTVNSGLISNNKDWRDQVLAAAQEAGENMWELPNNEEYAKQLKSSAADLKNTGGRKAGAITGGLFIGEFAGKTPWAHIDIAGTSSAEKTEGYNVKGATGVGIRTLVELAKSLQEK